MSGSSAGEVILGREQNMNGGLEEWISVEFRDILEKRESLKVRQPQVGNPARRPLTVCGFWGTLLSLSEPQFLHLYYGNIVIYSAGLF